MVRDHSKKSSKWRERRSRDHFADHARSVGYRSRAAWKLIEINKKDRLMREGSVIVDLGAAPGSWSQVALEEAGATGCVVAVDKLQIKPLDNLKIINGDFMNPNVRASVREALGNRVIDLVLSDMAPNITGVRDIDQARSVGLATEARDFALEHLRPGGRLVLKLFGGPESARFQRDTRKLFNACLVRKPYSSRPESTEFFLVARQ